MRKLTLLILAAALFSCQDNGSMKTEAVTIESASENPCIQCTERIKKNLEDCLKSAGNDEAKKSACNKKASEDWVRECKAICVPPPQGTALQETPRMKCLREAQEAHLKCLKKARNAADTTACNKALAAAVLACPPPSPDDN